MKFKKVVSFAVAAAMSAMLLTSCGEESEIPEGMQLIDSEFVSYTFYAPDDWTPDTNIDGFLSAKANDNSNVSIQTMTWNNSYGSLDTYFREDYLKKLDSTFKSLTLLEEECSAENQTVGVQKNPAAKYVYLVESDGTTYKIMQYFTYNAGYLYILTYTAQESLFSEHLEEVSSIVQNFVF